MAKIGFIGTGIMGKPMAQNLQKAATACSFPPTTTPLRPTCWRPAPLPWPT